MNKRMRKKQRKRASLEWLKPRAFRHLMDEFRRLKLSSPLEDGYMLLQHPRRQWLTTKEFSRKRAAFYTMLEAERTFVREKLKTHDCTLGGWRPKRESSPKREESGIVDA